MVERHLCGPLIQGRVFRSVDEFLRVAQSIIQRRRSRAGWSLENHCEQLLTAAGIPFEMRPKVDGEPDVLIPGRAAYEDPSYPAEKLVVLAIKTTCKDRWRQVLREATNREIPNRHLLTIQQGISQSQLREMAEADVQLVVPNRLHRHYPTNGRDQLAKVEDFVQSVQGIVG